MSGFNPSCMDALAALRSRGRWTRAAILSTLLREPGTSRSAMARRLGLTAQAVSVQVQELATEGLVEAAGLRLTPAGVQALQQDAEALADATARLRAPLASLDVLSAVAATRIHAGDGVGLWMEGGELVADPARFGASRGVAENAATRGDEVRVRGAQGMVELRPGSIDVIRVPEPARGGVAAVDRGSIPKLPPDSVVAALGTGAAILAHQLGRLDIRFAAAEGALNAAQRGLHVRLYVSGDQVADALRVIEAGRSVDVSVMDAPVA